MLPETDRIRLRHMLDACVEARGYIDGRTRADLDRDGMLLRALVNCLEIVGEAAARVSEETRQRIPSVPWKAVISMRNRLIHASFDINRDTVWMTVSSELVPLEEAIKEALASDTPSGDQVTP